MYCQALLLLVILMVFMVSRPLLWLVAAGQVAVIIIGRLTHTYIESMLQTFLSRWVRLHVTWWRRAWESLRRTCRPAWRPATLTSWRPSSRRRCLCLSICLSVFLSIYLVEMQMSSRRSCNFQCARLLWAAQIIYLWRVIYVTIYIMYLCVYLII